MGNLGAVIAVAVGDIPTYLVVTYGLRKEGLTCFWEDMKLTVMFLGILAIILVVRMSLGGGLPIDHLSPQDIRPINKVF